MSATKQALSIGNPQLMLTTVWQRNLPLVRERLHRLSAAARHAEAGLLSPSARLEAADIAHKLAGSLGMFGYVQGTEIARQMEILLDAGDPVSSTRLEELTAQLGRALPV